VQRAKLSVHFVAKRKAENNCVEQDEFVRNTLEAKLINAFDRRDGEKKNSECN